MWRLEFILGCYEPTRQRANNQYKREQCMNTTINYYRNLFALSCNKGDGFKRTFVLVLLTFPFRRLELYS